MIKKLVHISDLHFGTERNGIVDALIVDIQAINPDIIIVSGDLTQRARHSQFQQARIFLDQLSSSKVLCVPGNHDIALYNLIERFFYPYAKYKNYIANDICMNVLQDEIAVLGINSTTPYKSMGGYVTDEQLAAVGRFFKDHSNSKVKMIVMHHNLIKSERHKIINDSEKIIAAFAACNVNIILSGHIHAPHIEKLKNNDLAHHMYIVTAGTAISTRTTLPNSFNVLEFAEGQFKLSIREWLHEQFTSTSERIFPL